MSIRKIIVLCSLCLSIITHSSARASNKNTPRSPVHPNKHTLDFKSPYPEKWKRLPIIPYFTLLTKETMATPQFVIDWCKGMLDIFKDVKRQKEVNNFTYARCITLLGQRAKEDSVKSVLKKYFKENPEFLSTWFDTATYMLTHREFDEIQVTSIFGGLAKLGIKMPFDFERAWYNIAYGFLTAEHPEDQISQRSLTSILYKHAKHKIAMPADFTETLENALLAKLEADEFDQQSLGNIRYAYALKGQPLPPALSHYWEKAILLKLANHQFDAIGLTQIIYAYGLTGIKIPPHIYKAWRRSAILKLETKIDHEKFNPKLLVNILYAHAMLGLQPSDKFMKQWNVQALKYLELYKFNPQDLANIIYAHAMLRIPMPENFKHAWYKAVVVKLSAIAPKDQFLPQHLTNIVYAHTLLDLELNGRFKKAFEKAVIVVLKAKHKKDQFRPQQLANLFYAYALLDQEPHKDMIQPLFEIMRTLKDQHALQCLYLCLQSFRLTKGLPQEVKEKFDRQQSKLKKADSTISNLQLSVETVLTSMYLRQVVKKEFWFDCIASHVDFYIPHLNMVIEVDGPYHFIEKTHTYNQSTLLRNRILQRSHNGLKVLRIPYFEWDQLDTLEKKEAYLIHIERT
jgi:very-short-patch-repair endonuclease